MTRRPTPAVYLGIYLPILVLALGILYPFWYFAVNSLNDRLFFGPVWLFAERLTLRNYEIIFGNGLLLNAFLMSVSRTVAGTVLTVLNCAMCAFALRKRNLPWRNLYLVLFTIPLFFSGGLIPVYLNLRALGLLDRFLVYLLPNLFSFFYVVIFVAQFNEIPVSLEESARVDGAGWLRVFGSVYLPISAPVVAAIALFAGVAQWNSWLDTVYFTRSRWLDTLQALLVRVIKQSSMGDFTADAAQTMVDEANSFYLHPDGMQFATMLVTVVPIVLVYPFLQRYFIKGILVGAVKE